MNNVITIISSLWQKYHLWHYIKTLSHTMKLLQFYNQSLSKLHFTYITFQTCITIPNSNEFNPDGHFRQVLHKYRNYTIKTQGSLYWKLNIAMYNLIFIFSSFKILNTFMEKKLKISDFKDTTLEEEKNLVFKLIDISLKWT